VIDLHTHSNFSDGSDSPEELAAKAATLGITAIALTDHDTTASHERMAAACATHGIDLLPGVEISLVDHEFPRVTKEGTSGRGVHVLAYNLPLDPASPMQQLLVTLRTDRESRNARLVARLQELGFTRLTVAYLEERAGAEQSIGRPHVAQAMYDLHPEIVGTFDPNVGFAPIFDEYLGTNGKAYLPKTDVTIEQAVQAAAGTSTFFSVAHPILNYAPDNIAADMPKVILSLRERGFQGVEAHYGSTTAATRELMIKLTRDAGMIPTGGSDYHGGNKTMAKLGVGAYGDLRVPSSVLEEIRAACVVR
jgi:predicted metal-dependent phosphoesterase TrpH